MACSRQTSSTTSNQIFYYRLQILRGKIDDQLRDEVYVKLKTRDPGQIYQVFLSKKAEIDNLKKKKVM